MTIVKHFVLTFALTLFALLANVHAQTPRMATINITPDADKVRISAIGDVSEIRVDIADEAGEVVFQSGAISGQPLDWNMKDAQGERVPAGIYLVTVTFRNAAGKLRKRVEQVAVDEAEKVETKRTLAPEAVQATITGAGTTGKIAKFTGAATIADSVITESASGGYLGIGAAPVSPWRLDVTGPVRVKPHTAGDIRFSAPNAETGISIIRGTAGRADIRYDGARLKLVTATGTAIPAATNGIVITNAGKVGIGVTSPTAEKLRVEANSSGGTAVYGNATNGTGVYGNAGSGNGVYGRSISGYGVVGESDSNWAGAFIGDVLVSKTLNVGNGCYGCNPPSDRNLKANFSTINPRFILDRLSTIPIQSWNYKSESDAVRHIGPMAQDFRAAFGLGKDDHTLNTVDVNGVTMASIQALYQMMQEKDRQIEQQELKNKAQSRQIEQLQVQLNQVKRTIKRKRTARK